MGTHLLIFLFEKLEIFKDIFFNNRYIIGDFVFKYFILFVVIVRDNGIFKMFQNVSTCNKYKQITSDDLVLDLVNRIKKIHGL